MTSLRATPLHCALCAKPIAASAQHLLSDTGVLCCGRCADLTTTHATLWPDCPEHWHDFYDHPIQICSRAAARLLTGAP